MSKSFDGFIPFDELGNLLTYAPHERDPNNPLCGPCYSDKGKWIKNFDFYDKLHIDNCHRGRSAANFQLSSDINGKEYTMFMSDLVDMIQKTTIIKGSIEGIWTFCKKGSNYGIVFLK